MIQAGRKQFEAQVAYLLGLLVSDGYTLYKNWEGKGRRPAWHRKRAPKKLPEDPVPDIASCGQRMVRELDRHIRMEYANPAKAMRSLLNARIAKLLNKYREERTPAGMLGFSANALRPKWNA